MALSTMWLPAHSVVVLRLSLSFSFYLINYVIRHISIAQGVPFHTQLRLNASLRIGTSVAVEHDSLSDSATY